MRSPARLPRGSSACSPRPFSPAMVSSPRTRPRRGCTGPGRRRTPDRPSRCRRSRGRRIRLAGVRAHRSLVLFDADRAVRGGIPCTSPARLVVDLSGRRSVAELGRVVDDLHRRRLVRLPQIAQCAQSAAAARPVDRWPPCARCSSSGGRATTRATAIWSHGCCVRCTRPASRSRASRCASRIGGRRCYLDLAYPELQARHRDRQLGLPPLPLERSTATGPRATSSRCSGGRCSGSPTR